MSSVQKATTGDCLTAKALGTRMGVSRKRVRAILRADCPGDAKAKAWDIPTALAKDVQRKYKAKADEREGKRKTAIKNKSNSG